MYNRDPFNLRRNVPALQLVRAQATVAARNVSREAVSFGQQAFETGKHAIEQAVKPDIPISALPGRADNMSYGLPQNEPTHRHGDGWRPRQTENGRANGAMAETMSNIFSGDRKRTLPMYKDKPYAYPGTSRKLPWFRRKRVFAAVLLSFAGLLYYFGILSPLSYFQTSDEQKGTKSESPWGLLGSKKGSIDWNERRDRARDAFKLSWNAYERYAWGYDEFQPVSKGKRNMVPNGMGWIIVDALDTLMLMNLTTELAHARQWINTNLTYDQNHDVSTFETTIRMLGGMLSAHYLSTSAPPGYRIGIVDDLSEDMYLEKATDLADRLLGAYESQSGVPFASVNLHTRQGIPSRDDGGASSTAEATSLQLEMKYLAKLTGETHYWDRAEHVMQAVDDNGMRDGLLPIFIYADQGHFRGANIRLGSRGDSYYEYLIKQYLQTSKQEPIYQEMWNQSLAGVRKHLLTYSSPSNFVVLAERPSGLDKDISPKMDHLVCFMPGAIALGATEGLTLKEAKTLPSWTKQKEEEMYLAEELMKTCWGMYKVTATGLAGEITYFNIHDPPIMIDTDRPRKSPESLEDPSDTHWKGDYIVKPSDQHNLQRPETVESLFYMYRITGDHKYRNWGWEMFQSFIAHTAVEDGSGFSSISNVNAIPSPTRDNMESFWLAETLKYFYLLFGPEDILPLKDVVFNTEAHAFPRFEMGKLFKTGWERKPRNAEGEIIWPHVEEVRSMQTTISVVATVTVRGSPDSSTSGAATAASEVSVSVPRSVVATAKESDSTTPA